MPKLNNIPAPTRCVYCARTFSKRHGRDRSGEHIIPRWSHSLFERPGGDLLHQRIGLARQIDGKTHLVMPNFRKRAGDFASRQVKVVCSDCNSGWMSRLEGEVRDYLSSLVTGELVSLTPEHQSFVAKWVAMKTMLAEYTSPADLVIPRSELHRFYAERTLTSSWRIAIGPREAQDPWYFHRSWSVGRNREDADAAGQNLQRTFLGVGKLIIESLYCSHDGAIFEPAPEGFVEIFPAAEPFPVIPISPRITDATLDKVAYGSQPLKNAKHSSKTVVISPSDHSTVSS